MFNRYLLLEGILEEKKIYLHNIYAPVTPNDRIEFFQQLSLIKYDKEAIHIIGDDFNCAIDYNLDQSNNNNNNYIGTVELIQWMEQINVIDIWRLNHPNKKEYTSPKNKNRIDYIFLSKSLIENSNYKSIQNKFKFADHKIIQVDINNYNIKKIKGPWKCPNYLYSHPKFIKLVEEHLSHLENKLQNSKNLGIIYDNFKTTLKKNTKRLNNYLQIKIKKQQETQLKEIKKSTKNRRNLQ